MNPTLIAYSFFHFFGDVVGTLLQVLFGTWGDQRRKLILSYNGNAA
jgi:hypothetical protein